MAATSSNVGAIANQPDNTNYLSPLGFNFSIQKIPHANYFLQSANLPSVQLGDLETPSPFVSIPQIGDHLRYGDLFITFKVDEDMKNYLELYNWMIQLGFPESFQQSKEIYQGKEVKNELVQNAAFSDATLTVTNSAMRPNLSILYEDAYPVSLSDITFSTQETSVNYVECQVSFRYRQFKIFDLGDGGREEVSTSAFTS